MTAEFTLIQRHFTRPTQQTALGIGDDAAVINIPAGQQLAITTDMLVAGTHFYPDTEPESLGWKTLAVNLSDLAAMGAKPLWATLSLSLPHIDNDWLSAFAQGFFSCAQIFGVDLIGGDTTRGPLTMSVQALGTVPIGCALTRNGAQIGDDIWVGDLVGQAALALATLQGKITLIDADWTCCQSALLRPIPQVDLGLALRGIAHSAIDVSDGLLSEAMHLAKASGVRARIYWQYVPHRLCMGISENILRELCLSGGEDYVLLFTAPPSTRLQLENLSPPPTRIGEICNGEGVEILDANHQPISIRQFGYEHF